MRNDNLKKYISLKEELTREKEALEKRLALINEALGEPVTEPAAGAFTSPAPPQSSRASQPRRGRRPAGSLSLKEAVLRATDSKPLTKQEILEEVQKMGYRFTTKDPMNSLGVILYGKNPRFRNENGRFSPLGNAPGAPSSSNPGATSASVRNNRAGARRQMSPEAKARIAAAQRARWAKSRSSK
jgi:hypothetical protein